MGLQKMTCKYSGLTPDQYHPDAKRLAARDYSFIVTRGESCVEVTFPDLPGCVTYGDTISEALGMVEDVKLVWISTLLKRGRPVPPPREEADFSGRFLVRGTPELHHKLAQLAVNSKVSLNQYVIQVLSEKVGLAQRVEPGSEKAADTLGALGDWLSKARILKPRKEDGIQTSTQDEVLAAA